MKFTTMILLVTMAVFGQGQIFDDFDLRPIIRSERVNRVKNVDPAKALKAISDAKLSTGIAVDLLTRTLPIYGGRRQKSLFEAKFAYDSLENASRAKGTQRPSDNAKGSDKRTSDKIKSIPEVRELSKREFNSTQVRLSNEEMNLAGVHLMDALKLIEPYDTVGGNALFDAKKYIRMAINDIERANGRIQDTRQKRIGRRN